MGMGTVKLQENIFSMAKNTGYAAVKGGLKACTVLVFAAVMLNFIGRESHAAYTESYVDTIVAALQTPLCVAMKEGYPRDGKRGYKIKQRCFHPEAVKSVKAVFTGNDCQDSWGFHFSGGPSTGAGCNGNYMYWAYACDNTSGRVSITPADAVYRRCMGATLTTYCNGKIEYSGQNYVPLDMDCSYITQSPCPVSITESDCCDTKYVNDIFPVCNDSDICCIDPCAPECGCCLN